MPLGVLGNFPQSSAISIFLNVSIKYIAADGERRRPIMLHRAFFGSIERFFGVMVEHGGAFPTWLSPVQVQVLGVRADHDPFAQEIVERSLEGIEPKWLKQTNH